MAKLLFRGLLFSAILAGIFSFVSPAWADNDHIIDNLSNNAWVTRQGQTTLSSVSIGDRLKNGDRLETLRGNSARISLDEAHQNLIRIDENTSVEVDDSDLRTGFVMTKGSMFASVKKLKPLSSFKITTPVAVATVRGTEFEVILTGNTVQILDYSGTVEVAKRNPAGVLSKETLILKPGEKITLEGPESPLKNGEINSAEMERLQALARELDAASEQLSPAKEPNKTKKEKNDGIVVNSYIIPPKK